MANKGSIFLDEIGDLDPGSQVKLLRVLQDRSYEVLGSSRTRMVDTRVICATNRDLAEMVDRGAFREDLLYRINLITIRLPPLRERAGDIPLLVNFFVDNLRELYNRPHLSVSRDAMKWLQQLPLPGNIRQLKNLVERTILVTKKDHLEADDFQLHLESAGRKKAPAALPEPGSLTLEEMEIQMITRAMDFHRNRITRVAKSLGITRSALYRRLQKYNIPYDEASD
jgi:transcriptional regulator with PAS, ATPase and Fis domain